MNSIALIEIVHKTGTKRQIQLMEWNNMSATLLPSDKAIGSSASTYLSGLSGIEFPFWNSALAAVRSIEHCPN